MGVYHKDGNWFIDYRTDNGRRKRKKIGPDKKLAETVLKKIRVEIAENKYLDIKKEQKIRFEDFADEYLEVYCKANNRSWKDADLPCIKRLKAHFSGKYLYEISPLMVEKFKLEQSKEIKPATTNRVLSCLRSMFNRAVSWDKFDGINPVKSVKFFKENNTIVRFLEKEEISRLLNNASSNLRPILIVALHTGMRKGEILNLKWNDIDFQRNIIYLRHTKNGEKREIPMNEQVRTALIGVKKIPETPYIFTNKDGLPYPDIRKSFFTALKKSGIINFRFHDLRHTFASQLVMSGVDLSTVRELLGHKSLEMTLRYSHLSPDHKKRAVDVLSSHLDTFRTLSPKERKAGEGNNFLTEIDKNTYTNRAHSSIG